MRHPIIQADLEAILSSPLPWENFDGATVLITGANGVLPAYMVETLLYHNEKYGADTQVLALVRSEERARERFGHLEERSDLQFLVQDVCVPVQYEGAIDFIIHAASQASPRYYGVDPCGTLTANLQGTSQLLELARKKSSRGFLFFSSGEVYGQLPPGAGSVREDGYGYVDPMQVRSCYAEGKRAGETMCVSWHHQHGVPAKVVRPFHTYGPGMRLDDGRVFADFVGDILNNRDIHLSSDGSAERAFCYLADATAGFFTVLLRGENGQAYNVSNDEAVVSIRGLAERLVNLYPEKGLQVTRKAAPTANSYLPSPIARTQPDTTKIRALGWAPTTTIEAGFRRTIESFHAPIS